MAICVILNSHQVLACLDGYMNIALEQTEEYANGQANKRWTKMHIMTKTCAAKEQVWRRLHPWQQRSLHLHRPQAVEPRRDCFWVEMFCFLPFFSQLWRNSLIFLNSSMYFVNPLKVWSGWSPILLKKVCPIAKCGRVKWIFQRNIALSGSQDGDGEQGGQEGRHREQGCFAQVLQQAAEGRRAQPGW